jgi:hypothetical protein
MVSSRGQVRCQPVEEASRDSLPGCVTIPKAPLQYCIALALPL